MSPILEYGVSLHVSRLSLRLAVRERASCLSKFVLDKMNYGDKQGYLRRFLVRCLLRE